MGELKAAVEKAAAAKKGSKKFAELKAAVEKAAAAKKGSNQDEDLEWGKWGKDGRMDRSGQSGDGKLPGNWAWERFKVICAANCPAYWAGTITWGAKSVNECNWQCSCKA